MSALADSGALHLCIRELLAIQRNLAQLALVFEANPAAALEGGELLPGRQFSVTKGRWLPPMVFATLMVLAADMVHECLRPEAPAATPASTARG